MPLSFSWGFFFDLLPLSLYQQEEPRRAINHLHLRVIEPVKYIGLQLLLFSK
jgi:hypothetical protein